MDNFNNTAVGGNDTPETGGKTFSQDDVNRIVQERLAKEKIKSEAALTQREQELAKRELLLSAKEKLTAKGLSLELLDALNMSSPEDLDKSIAILEKHQPKQQTPQSVTPAFRMKGASPADGIRRGEYDPDEGLDASVKKAMGLR